MSNAGARSLRSKSATRNKVKFNHIAGKRIDSDSDSDSDSDAGVINGRRIAKQTQTVQCKLCLKDIVVQAGKSLPAVLNGHKANCRRPPKGPENRNDAESENISGARRLYSNISQEEDLSFWSGGKRKDGAKENDEGMIIQRLGFVNNPNAFNSPLRSLL